MATCGEHLPSVCSVRHVVRGVVLSERLTEVVLRIVEGIPVGLVASYGDLAATLDVSPRQVARVMSQSGSGVPWWRVLRADGTLPEALRDEARAHWHEEGVPLRRDGTGVQLRECRFDGELLDTLVVQVVGSLKD
ncbi:MAG: MGMT family protein [Nocardioidaceae bacterium]|nr:MGMT family protein [Nocardioidaceae bacterium]MCB8992690.1 MGMT family protein [Nocardioidaceae bacterium]